MIRRSTPDPAPLKRLLHQRAATLRPPRPRTTLHASEVTNPRATHTFCPRRSALFDTLDITWPSDFLPTALRSTFDQGLAMQALLPAKYLADVAYGAWLCVLCDAPHPHQGFHPGPDATCPTCGAWRFVYEELRATSTDTGISCGLDLVVRFSPRAPYRLYEIKIMGREQFKKLAAPLAEHRLRTALYLRCVAESVDPVVQRIDTSSAGVLYMGRCYGFKDEAVKAYPFRDRAISPYREYRVARDDAVTDTACNRARTLTRWRANPAGMPAGVCSAATDPLARVCPARDACFSSDHPATLTWHERGKPRHPALTSTTTAPG